MFNAQKPSLDELPSSAQLMAQWQFNTVPAEGLHGRSED